MSEISVKVDAREVLEALEKLEGPALNRTLTRSSKKGAVFLAQRARPEAPVGTRPKPATKRLRRTISARGAKRDKPAAVVVVRARHRHLVLLGTAQRFDDGASRGVMPANPFISRTADAYGDQALDLVSKEIVDGVGLE